MGEIKMLKKVNITLVILGYLIFLVSFFLPADFLSNFLGNFRFAGFVTIVICPVLGIFGLIFTYRAYKFGNVFLILANLGLLFSFPIGWFVTSLFAIR